jgi:hypothetical protein
MDAQTAAAFAGEAAKLNVLYVVFALVVVAATVALIAALGERALGFSLREFIDNVEKVADQGNVWPGVVLILGVFALLGIILWLGLR